MMELVIMLDWNGLHKNMIGLDIVKFIDLCDWSILIKVGMKYYAYQWMSLFYVFVFFFIFFESA